MELNTEFHQQLQCCVALHKIRVEPADDMTEVYVFGINHVENVTLHSVNLR